VLEKCIEVLSHDGMQHGGFRLPSADRVAVRTMFSNITTNAFAARALARAAAQRLDEAMMG
jgi:hypothetical protein